jgi:pyruvate kinase
MRRAKIVCTIGPTSRAPEILERLFDAGMDVARLNMSHGTQEEHAAVVEELRRISARRGRPVAVLLDLAGPKIRLGRFLAPVLLHKDDEVTLTVEDVVGDARVLPVNYPALPRELSPGDRLSLADGLILLEVLGTDSSSVRARVLAGGQVASHKGVNLPTGGDALPSLTDKDAEDLRFGLRVGVDAVALSFVRSAGDAALPRAIIEEGGRPVPLLAKIEKRQALLEIDGIVAGFDGLMVARGDLGVEVALEDVPGIQKDLIARANAAGKPVITATQMLLSMVASPRPTRAEVTDVANAILDGTDAVMLSEETAQGQYPVEAVTTMATIADRAEGLRQSHGAAGTAALSGGVGAAIAVATWQVARQVGAVAVVTPSASGSTARLVASTRPAIPILALSSVALTVRSLCLTWGVIPRALPPVSTTDELFQACRREAVAAGLARSGDRIVVTAGVPVNQAGTTNLLKVLEV